ncbi:MAG: hypothetical protein U0835_08625 [Isosphaeraceae bacterium]
MIALAFTPDGRSLVAAGNDAVQVWDLDGNTVRHVLKTPDGRPVQAIAVSRRPFSRRHDTGVTLWDLQTGESLLRKVPDSAVSRLAFTRDGRLITGLLTDRNITLWNLTGLGGSVPRPRRDVCRLQTARSPCPRPDPTRHLDHLRPGPGRLSAGG